MIKAISLAVAYIITGLLYMIFYPLYIICMVIRLISSSGETLFKIIIDKITKSLHENQDGNDI